MNQQQEYLDNLRHSAAHLLAAAVMELWPNTKRTIGPAIENGFYFDFEFESPISDEDLPKIEKKMHEIVAHWHGFTRHELSTEDAKTEYPNNQYKHELIDEFSGEGQTLTFYKSGEYWDLCRGGHIEDAAQELQHFKLLSLAGAYWRGDENQPMLTRIYGTAFPSAQELDVYLTMLEEAKKRDHRKLGKELDLFTFSELVGPGLPLWAPKGAFLRNKLDEFVWKLRQAKGYQKVEIPHVTKKDLYETSGHWDKFSDELFRIQTREGHEFAMKPMNCPHHTQIFDRRPHSYREMPQRYANTTMVYRDEQTGELSGLSRVRSITQDDAHVFCRQTQVKDEMNKIWDIIHTFYGAFGFDLRVRLSLHDPKHPENYLGTSENWALSEGQMRELIQEHGVEFTEAPGEAAFYGPKIDFMSKDAIGREWQVATIQLDMNMPERFNLNCINESGDAERVVMIHAAIMGAIERFLSVLIEHFSGAFPAWLAPVQAVIIPITADHSAYAHELADFFAQYDVRVEVWDEAETMQNRIRKAEQSKVPFMLVVGGKEQENHTSGTLKHAISVRARGNQARRDITTANQLVVDILAETPDALKPTSYPEITE